VIGFPSTARLDDSLCTIWMEGVGHGLLRGAGSGLALPQRGRVSYRALQRQFDLDDASWRT
jgi:hypothetical protein